MIQPIAKIVNFKSFTDMLAALPDDMACNQYLEGIIWNNMPTCPHCKSKHSYQITHKGAFKGNYKCKDCKLRYNVKYGTMFEGTHIGLRKWFIAIYIFSLHKKGMSSHQLASDIGITQKSAWYLLQRIRHAFKANSLSGSESSTYEIDATYIGGKAKNKTAKKRKELKEKFGRGTGGKQAVMGILERNGNVTTRLVDSEAKENVQPIIEEIIGSNAIVITDAHAGYKELNADYFHVVVNHQSGQYVKGIFHTNSIEGFWSQLKRGIYGVYHHVSIKHLHAYCNEFSYRYNVRKQTVNEKFNFSLQHSTRLKYKHLIAA